MLLYTNIAFFCFSSSQYIYSALLEAVARWHLCWSDDAGNNITNSNRNNNSVLYYGVEQTCLLWLDYWWRP